MRKYIKSSWCLLLFAVASLASCSSEDNVTPPKKNIVENPVPIPIPVQPPIVNENISKAVSNMPLTLSSIKAERVTIDADLKSILANYVIPYHGVCISVKSNPIKDGEFVKSFVGKLSTYGTSISNPTGLSPVTLYYIKAYVVIGGVVYYSAETSFTTKSLIQTTYVTPSHRRIMCSGEISVDYPKGNLREIGMCYSDVNTTPTIFDSKASFSDLTLISGSGYYEIEISKLEPNTKIYVRAYMVSLDGTVLYGDTKLTTTLIPGLPQVSTTSANVNPYALQSGTGPYKGKTFFTAALVSDGASQITEYGFCYASHDSPSINDIKIKAYKPNMNQYQFDRYTYEVSFEISYRDLDVIYVNSYAINKYGVSYGIVIRVVCRRNTF